MENIKIRPLKKPWLGRLGLFEAQFSLEKTPPTQQKFITKYVQFTTVSLFLWVSLYKSDLQIYCYRNLWRIVCE